ncbi:MAG: hypothetical protein ACP5M4_07090 [Acidobacteriaceae bacterium]
MNSILSRISASPLGAVVILAIAAFLEVYGDALFQSALYRSVGSRRVALFVCGAMTLTLYSLFLNSSRLDFGKLLGVYVVLFFVVAQVVAWFQFGERPNLPIWMGGGLTVLGGIVMSVWR